MRIFFDSSSNDKRRISYHGMPVVLLLLISSITCVSCFDVGVSPGSICCGDWITVTISVTNTGNSIFTGRAEIYIVEANGYQIPMDGLSITLQPHESRTLQTKIRPRDCTSYGAYQVVVKLIADNGQEQGTRTSTFVVKDPASCPGGGSGGKQQGCTWTFNCENNIVRRLCIDQYGREYWQDYDNCNNYNPPRECINGVCVEIEPQLCNPQTCPPPGKCVNGVCISIPPCDQKRCQSQNKPVGTIYTKNGIKYQKYMECNCVDSQCACEEIEKPMENQLKNDLAIIYVKSPSVIGLGEDLANIEIVLNNKGDTKIKAKVPIKLELIDDLDRKGHHHVDTYLDQSRKHTWQSHQIIVDIDMNPNDVGVFGPYKFKVSDRFEDYCIFANRLRAELDYTDDDKSNNVWLNDLFVTLGTRETDCVASAAISAISGAVSSVCDKAVIESSQPLLKTIQESYNNALIAFEKLDFDAAREAIIRLFLKLPQKYQTDFLISFANNFIEDFLTLPNCALAGYAQITNFFLDLEDDLIDVGVSQDTIEIINKIVKTGLTKI